MKYLLLSFIFVSVSSWAHDLNFKNYLQMQDSLAKDDFKAALASHATICTKDLVHNMDDYKDCKASFKNIEQLRESFKSLSTLFIENGDKKGLKNLMVAECPMAKAKWIQEKGSIRNPYYGKSMLQCGQKI